MNHVWVVIARQGIWSDIDTWFVAAFMPDSRPAAETMAAEMTALVAEVFSGSDDHFYPEEVDVWDVDQEAAAMLIALDPHVVDYSARKDLRYYVEGVPVGPGDGRITATVEVQS